MKVYVEIAGANTYTLIMNTYFAGNFGNNLTKNMSYNLYINFYNGSALLGTSRIISFTTGTGKIYK
jgi:hypothetical protein